MDLQLFGDDRSRIKIIESDSPRDRGKIKKRKDQHIAPRKEVVHRLIKERLAADLALFQDAAKAAHEAAIHEENVPDNKYDTLSLEASYVAQGQANRAQELRLALHAYHSLALQQFDDGSPIRLTALVTLESEDGETRTLFIGPQEGGLKLVVDGEEIVTITAGSPLGADLIGKCVGEVVKIGRQEFEIAAVS
jgi:transcription elongation GreA/GreB family factor